ncbi:hypothetical protein MLD38_004406 [Melastoma candidum]|uniref:Uncharacterized protein n=1 Tax=Melastoma candidum TaxID=119954 RepID=A0ACB9S532_9MYRT|nr:hypothetical protein MLD38_004406 [Melastoma candidum]
MKLPFTNCAPTTALNSPFLPPPPSHPHRKPHHPRPTITMSSSPSLSPLRPHPPHRKEKLLVILGATGAGKSRLSVDLATRFPSSEIINSDKIQVYSGLDITTNKIPVPDRRGVPHHLLGCFRQDRIDFTPSMFRNVASSVVSAVHSRRGIPILVGGSNSFVHALVSSGEWLEEDVFGAGGTMGPCPSRELRYDCCFLWVDVSGEVLEEYLDRRVEEMLEQGMVEELWGYYEEGRREYGRGLRRAIGVEEFDRYFETGRRREYEGAVREVKENTKRLAKRQVGKIARMRDGGGWELWRLDATGSFRELLMRTSGWRGIWERDVLSPSLDIVTRFLHHHHHHHPHPH